MVKPERGYAKRLLGLAASLGFGMVAVYCWKMQHTSGKDWLTGMILSAIAAIFFLLVAAGIAR